MRRTIPAPLRSFLEGLEDRTSPAVFVTGRELSPAQPTTADEISTTLQAAFSTGGYTYTDPPEVVWYGNSYDVTLRAWSPRPGVIRNQVLRPFTVTVSLGTLPAGRYNELWRVALDDRVVETRGGSFTVEYLPTPLPLVASPPPNSHGVPLGAAVSATYPRGLDPASVSAGTFTVHAGETGRLVAAGDRYSASGTTAELTRSGRFRPGELVQVTATTGVRTPNGPAAPRPTVWQFRAATSGGTGRFTAAGQTLPAGRHTAVALGDLDGDGDLDAFALGGAVWRNEGGGRFAAPAGPAVSGEAVRLGDMDGDGDLDAVVATRGPGQVWTNDGRGGFTDSGQRLGSTHAGAVALGDVDGDGDLDALFGKLSPFLNRSEPSEVWVNDGTGHLTDSGQRLGSGLTFGAALADLDNDGYLDVVLGNAAAYGGLPTQVFRNDGRGRFTDSGQRLGRANSNTVGVAVGDLDGDGDADLVLANLGQASTVWLNDGRGTFAPGAVIGPDSDAPSLSFNATREVLLGDLDADGDLDAVLVNGGSPGQPDQVWTNDGRGGFADSGQRLGGYDGYDGALGDLDGDGDLDAFVANQGTDPQPNEVWLNLDRNAPPHVFVADARVREGDGGSAELVFDLTLSAPARGDVTIQYATADGTADGADYEATAGTLTIPPGASTGRVVVPVYGDGTVEPDETLGLLLSAPAGAVLADDRADGTITNDDTPTLLAEDVRVAEGHGGTTGFDVLVTLSQPSPVLVTVDYATANGTATNVFPDPDFSGTSGTLTFRPGGPTSLPVRLFVNGDRRPEPDEDFRLVLSNPRGATLAAADAVITVENDDGPGPPRVEVGDATVAEGDSGYTYLTFPITLSHASPQGITLGYWADDGNRTGTGYQVGEQEATAGTDYIFQNGFVNIAPGATEAAVTVWVVGDKVVEPHELFTLTLSRTIFVTLVDGQAVGAILNDDTGSPVVPPPPPPPRPTLSVAGPAPAAEGNAGTRPVVFTVRLSRASAGPVRVRYATADGTAVAGRDYVAAAGELTFPPGTLTRTVEVRVIGDTVAEPDEAFRLILSAPSGATLAGDRASASIQNDDRAPPPTPPVVSVTDPAPVPEGDTGVRTRLVTVRLSRSAVGVVEVDYATVAGTATAGNDYRTARGTLRFAPGETAKTLAVEVFGDTQFEPDETVFLELSTPRGGQLGAARARVTIENDDPAPPSASVADRPAVTEGNGGTRTVVFTVRLSKAPSRRVTVGYATADGTATAGSDYTAVRGQLTFAPGETAKTVAVTVRGDTRVEPNETFFLVLSDPSDLTIARGRGSVTILDDDLTRAQLAARIRDGGRIALAAAHVSGVPDTATAQRNLADAAAGRLSDRSVYENAPGGSVWLDPRMLRRMLALAERYTFRVSEIAGGSHGPNSRHYAGLAFDVTVIDGRPVDRNHPDLQAFLRLARALGASEVLGPGDPGHDGHIHVAWPRN